MAEPYRLGSGTREALRALIRVICPPPPAPQLADLEDRIEMSVRRNMRYFPPLIARAFTLLIHIVEWAPVWRFAALSRLRHLERGQAEAVLNSLSLSTSPVIRLVVMGVRNLILVTYYDQDEVHTALGYDVVPWMKNRIALRQRLIAGGTATADDHIHPHSHAVTP
jgi:hypothetical protein